MQTTILLNLPDIWERHDGYNCYNGRGATDITQSALRIETLEECKAECSKDPECTAVIFQSSISSCWLRKDVELSECATGYNHLALFLKTGIQVLKMLSLEIND